MEQSVNNTKDLAEGMFVENWPVWLRWTLFLPTAFIACILGSVLYMLFVSISGFLFGFNMSEGFYFQLVSSAIFGWAFVYAGSLMAPRYQFVVSIVLMVILSIIATILWFLSFSPYSSMSPLFYGIHTLAVLIAGGVAVFNIKDY